VRLVILMGVRTSNVLVRRATETQTEEE